MTDHQKVLVPVFVAKIGIPWVTFLVVFLADLQNLTNMWSTQWFDNSQNKVNWTTTYEEWSYEQKLYRNKLHNMYTYTIIYSHISIYTSYHLISHWLRKIIPFTNKYKKHYPWYHNSLVGTSERIQTLQFTEHRLHVLVGQDGQRTKHKLCKGTT